MSLAASVYILGCTSNDNYGEPEVVLMGHEAGEYLQRNFTCSEVAYLYLGNTSTCMERRLWISKHLGPESLLESGLFQPGSIIPSNIALKLVVESQQIVELHKAAWEANPLDNFAMIDYVSSEDFKESIVALVSATVSQRSPIIVQ